MHYIKGKIRNNKTDTKKLSKDAAEVKSLNPKCMNAQRSVVGSSSGINHS